MQDDKEEFFALIADEAEFLVLHKYAGVSVHRSGEVAGFTERVATALNYPKLWLVHRLDEVTSGLLLLAKSSAAAARLGELFAERKISKCYLALADGKPTKKQGRVRGDLQKTRGGSYRLSREMKAPSDTRFFSYALGKGRRLYILRPYTGKTHQLRVCMKSLAVPILGDQRYNPAAREQLREQLLSAADVPIAEGGLEAQKLAPELLATSRCYLHAWCLRFDYDGPRSYRCLPVQGEHFLDPEFQQIVKGIDAWELAWPN